MSLNDEDFSRINEFQIIREENSQVFYQYESDQDYAGDISFGEISHSSNIPKEYKNFDEILPASLQSNEEPVSHSSNIPEKYENFDEILPATENIKEFPNKAYANLMALVIENNLNNKAGNAIIKFFNKHSDLSQLLSLSKNIKTGRKFMDKMNISQLSYSKYCVFTHNSQDYFVHYRPIKNYATTTDTLGKSSLHPIYVSLGNISTWRRNKEDAKQLLGYLPILSAKNEKEKKFSEFKELACETFHNSIKFLLDPLFQGDGVDFNIDDKDIWFFPRISTIICDWPEACTFSLTYKSANSNYLCHFCLVQREDLINIRKEVILRNYINMKEYFNSNTSNLAGLEQVNNYFWSIPNLNIYAATVSDRMHHLDLGLFKYQIEFTMELLKKKKSLNKVNERIADISRHLQLKVFKKGIQLSRLTASEYRDIMKIMVFVVDDLQIEDLSEVYMKWNEMYLLSRSEKFKESDLENFQKAINDWAINGYTTKTYESLHKTYVKIPYRFSNKKEVEKQIMENIRHQAIVLRNHVGKTKTPMAFVYTAKLFDFDLSESIIEQNKKDPNLDKKMIKGFEKFIDCLKVYLNILNIISAESCRIKIYSSVILKNGTILHTKNDFHHRPWFSNIAVNMNEEELSEYLSNKGICYAQTLLITEIRLPNKSPIHLALVQWYDFIEETPFVYSCPLLRLVEVYNFIEIEAIEDTIHVQ
ncbi:hypothetical protein Glove_307g34 [Diversispora epigaea]|uniref:Uncharacterized protein n=1 Tax=Diversispora epigaea TaxID=1348612 RepID=A0A397HUE5_9GLOM|nr:hypothetical protein Glove_307g34 [Diversispora epigaea]